MSRKHRGTRIRLFLKVAAAGACFALLMTAMLAYQVSASTGNSEPERLALTAQATKPSVKGIKKSVPAKRTPPRHRPRKRRHRTETWAAYVKTERSTPEAVAARRRRRQEASRRRRNQAAARARRARAARVEARQARARQTEASGPPAPVEVPAPAPVTSEPS